MSRWTRGVWGVALVFALGACDVRTITEPTTKVLFVGNSLTYTNNLPAVLEALADSNGRQISADMIVTGGATLSEHLKYGAVSRALAPGDYDVVILQERGGDLVCYEFTQELIDQCAASSYAYNALSDLARSVNAKPILLGTYQHLLGTSDRLEKNEARVARDADVSEVAAISTALRYGREKLPKLQWLLESDSHPGRALTLLMAVEIYRDIYGVWPTADEITVRAPIYGPQASFDRTELIRDDSSTQAQSLTFHAAEVEQVIGVARHDYQESETL